MANKNLFAGATVGLPRADAVNEAGGCAYALPPKHALAQLAATGCFNGAFYAAAEDQLAALLGLAAQVEDNEYLAKLAVYSRECAYMKDMPAALLLVLSRRDTGLFHRAFDRVVDNGRVLRTLTQMLRSGRFGRKSLSYSLQRAFQRWLNGATVGQLLSASIGNDPSLRDVLRLARPTPADNTRRALFGWLAGRPVEKWAPATLSDLPAEVGALVAFRQAGSEAEQVGILSAHRFRWDLLADAALGRETWKAIARQMGAQALRMNLNTLLRHGVLEDDATVDYVAARIADPDEIHKAAQFPYQYLAAYLNAEPQVPLPIRTALCQAAEIACGNVPVLPGPVVIGVDTSGSMQSPVTGHRGGGTTKVRCVDVAALFAAAILRRNPGSVVVPFDTQAYDFDAEPGATILRLAHRLAAYGGGGTDCSLPLQRANTVLKERRFAGCVLVSDMESWVGTGRHGSTAVLTEWDGFVRNQSRIRSGPSDCLQAGNDRTARAGGPARPKLVCINLQPYATAQAPDRPDVLNVGGFGDAVFGTVAAFLDDDAGRFVREVESVVL